MRRRPVAGEAGGNVLHRGDWRLAPGAGEAFRGEGSGAAGGANEERAVPDHDEVMMAIATVIDPEAGMNVVDLGLVYGVVVDADRVVVTMTMTTPSCPVGDYLAGAVRDAILDAHPQCAVTVEVTFDPPWTPDRMSDAARAKFGW